MLITAESATSIRIQLPAAVYNEYVQRANLAKVDVEDVIVRQLTTTKDQDVERGRSIKLSPEDRQYVEKAFSRSFKDGRELAHHLEQVFSVKVDGFPISLSPDLLKRLEGRKGRMDFKAFIAETVTKQLEHFAGMR